MKTLCLCMIVKDETEVLKKCFDSIVKFIDYWVICDTGSTDGTQDFIKNYFSEKGIDGELHQDEWKNFGYNRTRVFELSKGKCDYNLVMDADDFLEGDLKKFKLFQKDVCGSYIKLVTGSNTHFYRVQIFNSSLDWKYYGVLHEYADCKDKKNLPLGKIDFCKIYDRRCGSRSKLSAEEKYKKDADILLDAVLKEPDNSRYHFYLAQSYRDCKNYEMAIIWYQKRSEMNNFDEEIYDSLYNIGICKMRLGYDFEKEVLYDFLKAYNFRKKRLEALFEIVKYYRIKQKYREGLAYGIMGYKNIFPEDEVLFIYKNIYDYMFIDEVSICAYWEGFYQLSYDLNQKIINEGKVSGDYLKRVKNNIEYSKKKLNNDDTTTKIKKGIDIYEKEKLSIGVMIPVTSNKREYKNIKETDFFKIFFPSFLETYDKSNRYKYNFYIGYDDVDEFHCENKETFEEHFNSFKKNFGISLVEVVGLKGKVGEIWSVLAEKASYDNDYLYQLGDDVKIETSGWEDGFIKELKNKNNIGVVGPHDNSTYIREGLITQSFVHVTHLQIFKKYFPDEIKNWYIDNWITDVYNGKSNKNFTVLNTCGGWEPRYEIVNDPDNFINVLKNSRNIYKEYLESLKIKNVILFKSKTNLHMVYEKIRILCSNRITKFHFDFKEKLTEENVKKFIKNNQIEFK